MIGIIGRSGTEVSKNQKSTKWEGTSGDRVIWSSDDLKTSTRQCRCGRTLF